VQQQKIDL